LLGLPKFDDVRSLRIMQRYTSTIGRDKFLDTSIIKDEGVNCVGADPQPVCELTLNLRINPVQAELASLTTQLLQSRSTLAQD